MSKIEKNNKIFNSLSGGIDANADAVLWQKISTILDVTALNRDSK